ncbi:MAG: dual specificity protein phosphatase family protein, partial [Opitutaceae bacterium]
MGGRFHLGRAGLGVIALLTQLFFSGCTLLHRGVEPTEGIPNFGIVTPKLYRGAQPDAAALAALERRGVKTILNLRQPDDVWAGEESAARALGMGYRNFPLPGLRAPTEQQIAELLALLDQLPSPVLVHCEHGADRTGTLVACYRMERQGWTLEEAMAEAERFGISPVQFGMRAFIRRKGGERAVGAKENAGGRESV